MDDLKQNQSANEKPKGNKIVNILIFIGMILLIQIPIGVSLIALPLSVNFHRIKYANNWYSTINHMVS